MTVMKKVHSAVWGTGSYMRKIVTRLQEYVEIDYFIDRDSSKGTILLDEKEITCITPTQISEKKIELVLIAVIDLKFSIEIEQFLKQNSIPYEFADYYMDKMDMLKAGSACEKDIKKNAEELKRVVFAQIPTYVCNYRCPYCYLIQGEERVFERRPNREPHRWDYIAKALSYRRMEGMAYIDLTSFGETLLYRDIIPLTKALLEERHIVSITTNGTINQKIDELLTLPDSLKERLFLRFSFHYFEMDESARRAFFTNIKKIRNSKASFTVVMVAGDLYEKFKDEIRTLFMRELGALPQLDFVRNSKNKKYELMSEANKDDYITTWSDFQSEKFEHRKYFYGRRIKEYCHGGNWACYINLFSGELYPCSQMQAITNIYDDIAKPISFQDFGVNCPCEWCANSIIWANFGALETEYQGSGYADIINRIDKNGSSWIKPDLYRILNQKLVN